MSGRARQRVAWPRAGARGYFGRGIVFLVGSKLRLCWMLGIVLACSCAAFGQHRGGRGGGGLGGPGISRPDGVEEKDSLKDFHQAMAVQATSQQVLQFAIVLKRTGAAKAALQKLQSGAKDDAVQPAKVEISLNDAVENASTEGLKFVEGFSPQQKSGLKDAIKRLQRAEAALEEERKAGAASLEAVTPGSPEAVSKSQNLDRALEEFSSQELALGKDMGIVLASGEDQEFRLPAVRNSMLAGSQTIGVSVAGLLTQVSAAGGQRTFKLAMIADLTDMQQNFTEVLRNRVERGDDCGERLVLRRATISPQEPAGIVDLQLHYERWSCIRALGQASSNELAESEGTVQLRLTPAVGTANAVTMNAVFTRIDASGMFEESLRSGQLGENLRDKVGQTVLSVLNRGTNLKTALPPVVQNSAAIRAAKFQDSGAGVLSALLDGQVQISDEQAKALADQLNQTLSAQAPVPR